MKPITVFAFAMGVGASLLPQTYASAQSTHSQAGAEQSSCMPAGDLHFVCGLINVEDLLPVVDGGRWLVGSSFQAGSAGLYLIDTTARTARPVSLSIAKVPDPQYAGCPAPDVKKLTTHGLDVVPGRGGKATVYAVNHAGRESIEIFRLDAAKNSAQWVGCVVEPAGANGNSVAALPRGGFVVTKFVDTRDKQGFQHIMSGAVTGVVYRWTPGKGFSEVPGTRLSGDNGVAVSRDGRWLYVNAYGSDEIYRVPLSGKGSATHVKVDFHPDNLRWAPDGTLFDTGQFIEPGRTGAPTAPDAWATVRLDPQTMAVAPVVKEPGRPEFGDATSAVQVGQTLWFGTFRGKSVAYRGE